MGLRLLGYMVRIWEKHRKGNKKARRLPPILPVLVCHDEEAWSAPRSFHELLDVSEDIASFVLRHVVSFEYLIDDLSGLREEELRARAMTAFAKVALFCLQRARGAEDMAAELERWSDALRELLAAPNGVEAFLAILRYILLVNETPPERLRDLTHAPPGRRPRKRT